MRADSRGQDERRPLGPSGEGPEPRPSRRRFQGRPTLPLPTGESRGPAQPDAWRRQGPKGSANCSRPRLGAGRRALRGTRSIPRDPAAEAGEGHRQASRPPSTRLLPFRIRAMRPRMDVGWVRNSQVFLPSRMRSIQGSRITSAFTGVHPAVYRCGSRRVSYCALTVAPKRAPTSPSETGGASMFCDRPRFRVSSWSRVRSKEAVPNVGWTAMGRWMVTGFSCPIR
jgi:hypothetical protein